MNLVKLVTMCMIQYPFKADNIKDLGAIASFKRIALIQRFQNEKKI